MESQIIDTSRSQFGRIWHRITLIEELCCFEAKTLRLYAFPEISLYATEQLHIENRLSKISKLHFYLLLIT